MNLLAFIIAAGLPLSLSNAQWKWADSPAPDR